MKVPIIAGVVILVLVLSLYFFNLLKKESFNPDDVAILIDEENSNSNTIEDMCFYSEMVDKRTGVVDFYTLNIYAIGNQVEGDLSMAFGDKPEKKGIFFGAIGTVRRGRIVDSWWDAYEGNLNKKEELRILIEDDTAKIGIGPMKDNGDGTYFYKSKNNLSFDLVLDRISCK